MLAASPLALASFIIFERRLKAREGAPLVDLSLFQAPGFTIGVTMALVYYMLSAFYLTFAIYLQGGLGMTPLAAGLATLPFGIGYFLASFAAAPIMRRLGPKALTLGFAVQVIGFSGVIFAVAGPLAGIRNVTLAVAGVGFGIVMPSVIKAIIGGVDQRHAGLASGIVMSTFQIGSALGVAIVGGLFFTLLVSSHDLAAYTHAFAVALGCNVALLAVGGFLSLGLPRA
jgi:predicted MFS family arabinose efflux permease